MITSTSMGKHTEGSWATGAWLVAALAMGIHGACGGHVTVESGGSGGVGGGGTTGGAAGTTSPTTTPTSPTTTTTVGPTTTTVGPTTTSTGSSLFTLGFPCEDDVFCGMGSHCVTAIANDPVFGGGAANGYCTHPCMSDAECDGPGSTCVFPDGGGTGECLLGCVFGDPPLFSLNDPLDPSKCRGREDLRCQQLPDGSEVCVPTCGSDAQCAGGFCDPKTGACVGVKPVGDPLGAACDPDAMVTSCQGICIQITGGKTMCTQTCTMGGEVPNEAECGGSQSGICIYSPSGTGVGDMGFCAQACAQQDACQTPDFFCFDVGQAESGVCLDSSPCLSDADCQNFPQGACVMTNLGPFCMSGKYPLGTLMP